MNRPDVSDCFSVAKVRSCKLAFVLRFVPENKVLKALEMEVVPLTRVKVDSLSSTQVIWTVISSYYSRF